MEFGEYVNLGLTVAGGVVIGILGAFGVFAAFAWTQDWWKNR